MRAPGVVSLVLLLGLWLGGPAVHAAQAAARPVLTLSVLQFGTAHWELEHLKRQALDAANGFDLQVRLVADLPASRLAVTSGSADGAVGDLLWAQQRYEAGTAYVFLPFSARIGELVVADDSAIRGLADLRGKRLGVAGGPDGQGWLLLQHAARQQGIDLAREADLQFAAPPLLGQALRRGQIDALLTFWHFAARMHGEGGVRTVFTLDESLRGAGLSADLPVLGYLFPEAWAARNGELLGRFERALRQTKQALAGDPAAWAALRPLMRAEDDAVFAALREGFVAGIPAPLDAARVGQLRQLLALTGADPARRMPETLFFRPAP